MQKERSIITNVIKKVVIAIIMLLLVIASLIFIDMCRIPYDTYKNQDRALASIMQKGLERYIKDTGDVKLKNLLDGNDLVFENVIRALQNTVMVGEEDMPYLRPLTEGYSLVPAEKGMNGWIVTIYTVSGDVVIESSIAKLYL